MKVLAVIAARGGPQRVPRKNIVPLLGRPMLAYTLDHARAARGIDRIVVSTEDAEIAEVARRLDAEVVCRPAEWATPDARLDHTLRHAVRELARTGYACDVVVLLYGAVPIRPEGFLDRCLDQLAATGADCIRSVAPLKDHHPLWSVKLDADGRLVEYLGKLQVYRRQELPPVYSYTGAAIVLRTATLMDPVVDPNDPFGYLGTDQRGAIHEPHECVEIHEPIDLLWAEFLVRRQWAAAADRVIGGGDHHER